MGRIAYNYTYIQSNWNRQFMGSVCIVSSDETTIWIIILFFSLILSSSIIIYHHHFHLSPLRVYFSSLSFASSLLGRSPSTTRSHAHTHTHIFWTFPIRITRVFYLVILAFKCSHHHQYFIITIIMNDHSTFHILFWYNFPTSLALLLSFFLSSFLALLLSPYIMSLTKDYQ